LKSSKQQSGCDPERTVPHRCAGRAIRLFFCKVRDEHRGAGGLVDKVPFGAAFGKGITMKMGQTNMHTYMKPLLERIEKGQIDPSCIISHRITLDEVPEMYKVWRDKMERVTKIVIDPWAEKAA
jgi:threonine dehydrogenase-like Zn-dependent dehydrogenase